MKPSKDYEQYKRRLRHMFSPPYSKHPENRPAKHPGGRPKSNHQCLGCGRLYHLKTDIFIPRCEKCNGRLVRISND